MIDKSKLNNVRNTQKLNISNLTMRQNPYSAPQKPIAPTHHSTKLI